MTTYGFLGAGNMVGAIVRGAVDAAPAHGAEQTFLVTSPHTSAQRLARSTGVEYVPSQTELVERSDVVVLGVKPHVVPTVLEELATALARHEPLIMSLAAGLDLGRLEAMAPSGARVVRTMANTAAAVGQSMTALARGTHATEADMVLAESLMGAVGRTVRLQDRDFPAFVGLAGSSPAFVFTFIEALARAGVLNGIPKAQAVEIVTQAVLGSALSVQAGGQADPVRTPADLTDAVCSPGGTTVAGLVALERAGFSDAVVRAVQATVARDRELGA